ncbi:MAG: NAD(P)/FAD-dependent oxidoreductase [Candidatus Saganbacteria bacterium]|nr:NAD(P)/FAD-dependent oxidoreductase [Candidatus Saganbacteria bacterium]
MKYDIAVIGAGPAGLMAALSAAQAGAKVVLLEKNDQLGRKLLLTGKGRCNLTQAEEDPVVFSEAFGRHGKFLLTALTTFGVKETVDFFNSAGVATKIERGQRVFPESDKAEDVLRALTGRIKALKVTVKTRSSIKKIIAKGRAIKQLTTAGTEIKADKYIIATGGLAYPATGSSGDAYAWLEELGHKIERLRPTLVPIKLKEKWCAELAGLGLRNVRLSVYQDNKKKSERFGEALFTHDGLSGPIVLDLSQEIGELFDKRPVELRLDLKPSLDHAKFDARLRRDFQKNLNKSFKNSLDDLLPASLIPVMIRLSGIDPEKKVNSVTKEERTKLLHLFKDLVLHVSGIHGFEQAIATAGGVSLKQIDPRTMHSKLIDNLYFAGEIIDLNGPTGGYNLQLCWSTGYLAGKSAAEE